MRASRIAVLVVGFCCLFSTTMVFAASTASTACAPMAVTRITSTIDEAALTTLHGNVHPLALTQYDQGKVDDGLTLQHIVMLLQRTPEQELAIQTRIDQMHNQQSPLFHQWLSSDEVGGCYGVADADIATITSWLQKHGFAVDSVPAGKTMVLFSGTAGQVAEAFHTEIHNLNVQGKKHIANMSDPKVPAALAPVIAGFRSLNDFLPKPMLHMVGVAKRDAKTGKLYVATDYGKQPTPVRFSRAARPVWLPTTTIHSAHRTTVNGWARRISTRSTTRDRC
jgi:hypothetical protein